MISVKTVSAAIKGGIRYIKVKVFSPKDVREAVQIAPFGIDSAPVANMQAIYGGTVAGGSNTIIGYVNKSVQAAAGEVRIFSVGSDEDIQASIWAKADGILELNGNDNWAVKFTELKTEFNELKTSHNDLVSKHNALLAEYKLHVHTGVTTGVGSSGATVSTQTNASSSTANIDNAKSGSIKIKS